MSENIDEDYLNWHKSKQAQQVELAKMRKSSFEKYKVKSVKEANCANELSTSDEEYQLEVQREMELNQTFVDNEEIIIVNSEEHELSEQEKWHREMQASQMEMAQNRKNSFTKFQLKSKQ